MPSYRWVVIKYRDGCKVCTIVEEQEVYPEMVTLAHLYGAKYRIGPRVDKDVAVALEAVGRQRRLMGRKIADQRPLSSGMGRGPGDAV